MLTAAARTMHYLVNSNLFISLAALCSVELTYVQLTGDLGLSSLSFLLFFGTWHTYLAQRLVRIDQRKQHQGSGMSYWLLDHKWFVRIMLLVGFTASAVCFVYLHLATQLTIVALAVVSMLYALPVFYWKGVWMRMRDVGVTKPLILGLVWAISTTWLPVMELGVAHTADVYWLMLERTLFFVAICVPFDVKDMDFDSETMKYKTIPLMFGLNGTKLITWLLLAACAVVVLLRHSLMDAYSLTALAGYMLALLVTAVLVGQMSQKKDEYFFTFWMDGLLILLPVLVIALW